MTTTLEQAVMPTVEMKCSFGVYGRCNRVVQVDQVHADRARAMKKANPNSAAVVYVENRYVLHDGEVACQEHMDIYSED